MQEVERWSLLYPTCPCVRRSWHSVVFSGKVPGLLLTIPRLVIFKSDAVHGRTEAPVRSMENCDDEVDSKLVRMVGSGPGSEFDLAAAFVDALCLAGRP